MEKNFVPIGLMGFVMVRVDDSLEFSDGCGGYVSFPAADVPGVLAGLREIYPEAFDPAPADPLDPTPAGAAAFVGGLLGVILGNRMGAELGDPFAGPLPTPPAPEGIRPPKKKRAARRGGAR